MTLPRSVFVSHHHVERELGENRVVMLGIKEAEQGCSFLIVGTKICWRGSGALLNYFPKIWYILIELGP